MKKNKKKGNLFPVEAFFTSERLHRGEKNKFKKESIPGSSSIILRASMAAAASMGGREAEKQ